MDVGIVSCGAYIPAIRFERKLAAAEWARNPISGERSVANNDEDTITMAVEAARNCLRDVQAQRTEIDGCFFASTTAPYAEKMSAVMISTVLDMRQDVRTADFAQSLRAGTGALMMAIDTVRSGSAANMLVAAADSRMAYPKSDQEQEFGDGSAAVLVGSGKEKLIATFEGGYSLSNEMMDVWRNPDDRYVKLWESRFILGEGYAKQIGKAVLGLMKKLNVNKEVISKVIIPSPDSRSYTQVAQRLGFDVKAQVQNPLMANVGFCGTAQPLLLLVSALEETRPGDLILMAAYGDGAEAMLFRATEKISNPVKRRTVKILLEDKIPISSYSRFLSYKGILDAVPGEPFRLMPSATVTWRQQDSLLRLYGSRCKQCGQVVYPIQRICEQCYSKDTYEKIPIADMRGKVFSFTRDFLAGRSDDPIICQTIVDLENGMRFYGLMTDCDPGRVDVGMPVELTFRRIYEGAGFHNYYWKCRPSTKGE
jgi:3-hydroxy-3-methylglutaryl CoA synthase